MRKDSKANGCSMHNLQSALKNGMLEVFGDGGVGLGKRTLLQLVHCCYDLWQHYGDQKLQKSMWEQALGYAWEDTDMLEEAHDFFEDAFEIFERVIEDGNEEQSGFEAQRT